MPTAIELAEFAEKNGWIEVEMGEEIKCYKTPEGKTVLVELNEDGSILQIHS